MDFGLALASTEDRLTKTGTLVGTVAYFSPEQVTSRSFDGRTDLYALGTVLYECLAGEPPFSGEVQSVLYRIVHELPRSLRALGADVGEELESILFQCLEKDPEKRPKRAGHLAEALRRYRGKLHEDEYTRSVMLTASRMVTQAAGGGLSRSSGARRRSPSCSEGFTRPWPGNASSPSWRASRDRQVPAHRAAHEPGARAEDPRARGPLRRAGPRLRAPGLLRADPGLLSRQGRRASSATSRPDFSDLAARPARALPRARRDRRAAVGRDGLRSGARARRPRTRSPSSS